MLNVGQVLAIVPVSRTTLWRLESQKKFPPGHMVLGTKLWFADEIAAWQDGLPAAKLSRRSRSGA
jgi:predicted DNA-binding transcriptional regulator AlpA